jgi:phosphate transport system substrate-binding protein
MGGYFAYDILTQWANKFVASNKNLQLTYTLRDSKTAIDLLKKGNLDFAISTIPLTTGELLLYDLEQYPIMGSGIVPIINLPNVNVTQLVLDGTSLANLYLGHIKYWDDPALRKLNPHVNLPHLAVKVFSNPTSSGINYNLSAYLSAVSIEWFKRVATSISLSWPAGEERNSMNEIANAVRQTPGAISYSEYPFAVEQKLMFPMLKNENGPAITANYNSFRRVNDNQQILLTKSHVLHIDEAKGFSQNAWPIMIANYLILRHSQEEGDTFRYSKAFLKYIYTQCGPEASAHSYLPIPPVFYQRLLAN